MFLFIWYLKLVKLGVSLISDERSFHNLIEEGKNDF